MTCTVDSADFRLDFRSPARIGLPGFLRRPDPAIITCSRNDMIGRTTLAATSVIVDVYDFTFPQRLAIIGTNHVINPKRIGSARRWVFEAPESTIWVELAKSE